MTRFNCCDVTSKPVNNKTPVATTRKAREFALRQQEILEVALECFSGEDWESVTVARIADIVGIAKGTMYLHFSSKQEIFARLAIDFYRSLLHHLQECAKHSKHDHLKHMVEQAFDFYLAKPKYRCVTQYCEREDFRRNLNTEIANEFEILDQSFQQLLRQALQRGISEGTYRPLEMEQVIPGLRCTFHGALTMLWCNRQGEQDSAQQFVSRISRYMTGPLLAEAVHKDKTTQNISPPSEHLPAPPTLETIP